MTTSASPFTAASLRVDAEAETARINDRLTAYLAESKRRGVVVALSGGYSRDEANEILTRNTGVIASFSRALTEGLSANQSDEEFDAALDTAISGIFAASAKA